MIKRYFYLIIFLFLLDCSLNPNSKFWTKEKKILVDKSSTTVLANNEIRIEAERRLKRKFGE